MDECKELLERIAVAVESQAEGTAFIVAELAQIRLLLGGN